MKDYTIEMDRHTDIDVYLTGVQLYVVFLSSDSTLNLTWSSSIAKMLSTYFLDRTIREIYTTKLWSHFVSSSPSLLSFALSKTSFSRLLALFLRLKSSIGLFLLHRNCVRL